MSEKLPLSDSALIFGALFVACITVGVGFLADPFAANRVADTWSQAMLAATVPTSTQNSCLKPIENKTGVSGAADFECLNGCTYVVETRWLSAGKPVNAYGTPNKDGPPGVEYYQALMGKPIGPVQCSGTVRQTAQNNFADLRTSGLGLEAGTSQTQLPASLGGSTASNIPLSSVTSKVGAPANLLPPDWTTGNTSLPGVQGPLAPVSYQTLCDSSGNCTDYIGADGYGPAQPTAPSGAGKVVSGGFPQPIPIDQQYGFDQSGKLIAGEIYPQVYPQPLPIEQEIGFDQDGNPYGATLQGSQNIAQTPPAPAVAPSAAAPTVAPPVATPPLNVWEDAQIRNLPGLTAEGNGDYTRWSWNSDANRWGVVEERTISGCVDTTTFAGWWLSYYDELSKLGRPTC